MIRSIDVAVVPALIGARPPAGAAVVIDVLRATSTIATALANGATSVIPVRDPEDAIGVRNRIGRERVLLCGERQSQLIPGFDLDNSPAAYTADRVRDRTLAFTSTNGSRALIEAARDTASVYCGALVNRDAIARALRDDEAGGDVLLVCAGNAGTLSFEDLLCAGAIVDALRAHAPALDRSDAAQAALTVFTANAKRLTTAVAGGTHARSLRAAGFGDDVVACTQLDVLDVVPVFRDGAITARRRSL